MIWDHLAFVSVNSCFLSTCLLSVGVNGVGKERHLFQTIREDLFRVICQSQEFQGVGNWVREERLSGKGLPTLPERN